MSEREPDLKGRGRLLDLLFLLSAAFLLAWWGGAPYYHPDTLIEKALRTLAQGGDPKFFNYPALLLYLNGFAYRTWIGLLQSGGALPGAIDPVAWYVTGIRSGLQTKLPLFALGHAINLFFSLLGVAATYLAAFRLTRSRLTALAAGLLLATSLLWASDAHYITVDTPLAALGITTVALTLVFTGPGRPLRGGQVMALGLLAGLTAAAKYNGALVLPAVAAASYLVQTDFETWFKQMFLLGATALVTFGLANPFIALGSQRFMDDFSFELRHSASGHPGFTTPSGFLYHLQTTLPLGIGWPVMALAALGLVWLVFSRGAPRVGKWGLLVYPLLMFLLIGGSHLAFQRYMLPLLPFLAILAALALTLPARAVIRHRPRLRIPLVLVGVTLFLAAGLPNLLNVLRSDYLLTGIDTRAYFVQILAKSKLARSAPRGFAGMYTSLYFNYQYTEEEAPSARLPVLVFDSFSHDRWIYDPTTRRSIYRGDFMPGDVVIQLSPFTKPKDQVPLAVQSIYSPYLPDLYDRLYAGPYIEMYLRDARLAADVMAACQKYGAPCSQSPANEGYYYRLAFK